MPNIIADTLTFFVYVGGTNGRIINDPQSGELDLRSILTTANTDRIYSIDPTTKAVRVCTPGNAFSQFQFLVPLSSYAIKAKEDFDLLDVLPHPDPAKAAPLLAAIRSVLDVAPSPNPNPNPNPSPNPPGPSPVTYNTSIVGIGQGESATAANVSLSAFVGDVLSFNSRSTTGGLPASMNVYVGSVAPENQVALVSFDSVYVGDRFSYLVKAGNHPSIAVDTTFGDTGLTFVDGDRILV